MNVVRDGTLALLNGGEAAVDVLDLGTAASDIIELGSAEFGNYMIVHEGAYPAYTGDTVITPSQTTVVLPAANTTVYTDIVINPIPSNYGLIAWNGSALTVS